MLFNFDVVLIYTLYIYREREILIYCYLLIMENNVI